MKKNRIDFEESFTLQELLIVVIIIGVLAGLVFPAYERTVDQSYERRLVIDMEAISAAQRIFKARQGECYPLGSTAWVDTINLSMANGGLGNVHLVQEPKKTKYRCRHAGGRCLCEVQYSRDGRFRLDNSWAAGSASDWEIMTRYSEWTPFCSPGSGSCPTCTSVGCR